ncbi:MAG: T9SS type A sorting domain-containing protein [Algibacter sp.]
MQEGNTLDLTLESLNVSDIELKSKIYLYPNPSLNYTSITGLDKEKEYIIYNSLGQKIMVGTVSNDVKINLENLKKGFYSIILDDLNSFRFLKK